MEEKKLEKLLQEIEEYAQYNIEVKKTLENCLQKCEVPSAKIHYEKEINFLIGRIIGLYMVAMTLRKMLNLEIPKDGNYQVCFEGVLK